MSNYFETISELRSTLDRSFAGCELRSIKNPNPHAGFRSMVWVSWTDGPRRSEVVPIVEQFRAAFAALNADLVACREFSSSASRIIAAGRAMWELPAHFWTSESVQNFDLSSVAGFVAMIETRLRDIRIAARARAIFDGTLAGRA